MQKSQRQSKYFDQNRKIQPSLGHENVQNLRGDISKNNSEVFLCANP